jgi:hypothetical protein
LRVFKVVFRLDSPSAQLFPHVVNIGTFYAAPGNNSQELTERRHSPKTISCGQLKEFSERLFDEED